MSKLAVYNGDFMTVQGLKDDVYSGYYSSKPDFKKEYKTSSSLAHIENKIYAKRVLNMNVTDQEVNDILKARNITLDSIAILDDMKSIEGLTNEDVQQFNQLKVDENLEISSNTIKKIMFKEVLSQTGL
jgi:hypothetical protein